MLVIQEEDRYSRLRLIQWWEQDKLRAARVLVVGAGALGNEVLKNLALVGIGQLQIVDCDLVEFSNLTRSVLYRRTDCGTAKAVAAAQALRDLNPDLSIDVIVGNVITEVGLGHFRDADVVIGCLDNREARLWLNRCCWKVGRPWIDGGIQEISGVTQVFVPADGPCYECGMTDTDYQLISLRYSCPMLPREAVASGNTPTTPTIASFVGGLQVQEALKLLHGLPTAAGSALVFNGVTNQFYQTRLPRREDCLSHESYPEPVALAFRSERETAAMLFEAVRALRPETGQMRLVLDRDLLVATICSECGARRTLMCPAMSAPHDALTCQECGQKTHLELTHAVNEGTVLAAQRLISLGIPPYDIVRVETDRGDHFFLLADDRPAGQPS